jgi:hypothetical protein
VESTDRAGRLIELAARIRDLHERNAQLPGGSGPPGFERRRTAGSTPAQVAKARTAARIAGMRALQSLQRAAAMRLNAASAHDRAARLHDMLADADSGNVQDHRDRAVTHRQLAREDRDAADAVSRSRHVQPRSGLS